MLAVSSVIVVTVYHPKLCDKRFNGFILALTVWHAGSTIMTNALEAASVEDLGPLVGYCDKPDVLVASELMNEILREDSDFRRSSWSTSTIRRAYTYV